VPDRLGRTHRRHTVVVHLNDETAASAEKPAHERITALDDDRVRVLVDLDAEPLGNPRVEELVEGAPPAAAGIGLTSHHTTVSPSRVRSPVTSNRNHRCHPAGRARAHWRRHDTAHTPSKKAEASIAPPRRTSAAAPKDHGYAVISALALAVEAVEALCTFLSDCDPGLTAAVRPFERAAL
jgi:hypothetical protein